MTTALALLAVFSSQQRPQNPFLPPSASIHYAPDRTYDLQNLTVDVDVDWPNRTITGHAVNTIEPLLTGITQLRFMAGTDIQINKVQIDGQETRYDRKDKWITISIPPVKTISPMKVTFDYKLSNSKASPFGGIGGWHWIATRDNEPTRVGFWTQGESESTSNWCPTWDYPNDLTTSETRCTVQADWDVIGNGKLISNKLSADGKRRTFDWKMTQPHATYLLSICGGPFDIKKDKWQDVDLWYVVPRGQGKYIDDSFGDTKDMLTFYSNALGVKYAWPKYAQDAMYDFGGGMENVSATTLGAGSITEAREGFRNMASLNSHELGHQWFGDLVTCKDWGDIFLNESFATYMQDMYFEHSRGKNGYDWEIADNIGSYLVEARRYKRPISTKLYPNADAMFDSHTYPKGGAVLHTLRRWLGDEAFFKGLNRYLTMWRHTPVESAQLRSALTEASGKNCDPFWAQWFDKPGHPVLDYTWTSDASGVIALTVNQKQDTSDGTPIYDIPTKVAIFSNGQRVDFPVVLNAASQVFNLPTAGKKVDAVLLDPDRDFLREIPELHWQTSELLPIMANAPCGPDRQEAMRRLLTKEVSDDVALQAAAIVAKDSTMFTAFRTINPLVVLERPALRAFFLSQLKHPNFEREAEAVSGLSRLPADAGTTAALRALVNDKAPIQVVINSITALAKWDKKGNEDVIKKAQVIPSRNDRIKRAADRLLSAE